MHFFDCNVYFGLPTLKPLAPIPQVTDLLAEMQRNNVDRALVWHILQHDAAPQVGNTALAEGISDHPELSGCWSILPSQTHELPPPDEFVRQMSAARVCAVRAFGWAQKYMLNSVTLGDWLETFSARHIPVMLSLRYGATWTEIYAILKDFPDLVCVVCDHGCWGEDRLFRPLIEKYPHVYIDTAQYLLDGGIEAFVRDYGPSRMLFGSGFPDSYFGGMMMALKHARIPDEAREVIASGNLERLLAEVKL